MVGGCFHRIFCGHTAGKTTEVLSTTYKIKSSRFDIPPLESKMRTFTGKYIYKYNKNVRKIWIKYVHIKLSRVGESAHTRNGEKQCCHNDTRVANWNTKIMY